LGHQENGKTKNQQQNGDAVSKNYPGDSIPKAGTKPFHHFGKYLEFSVVKKMGRIIV
jgi:hypothetical protein